MTVHEALAQLERTMTDAVPSEYPQLVGRLEQLKAMLYLRMTNGQAASAPLGETLLTIRDVAERLKVSEYRAYELARQGALKSVRLGKSVRVRPSDLAAYLALPGG